MTTFTRGVLFGVLIAAIGIVAGSDLGLAVAGPVVFVLALGLGLAASPRPPSQWRRPNLRRR